MIWRYGFPTLSSADPGGKKPSTRKPKAVPYRAIGASAQLFQCRDPEVLIEGPAGTGKTRAVLEYLCYLAENHSNIRVLLLRAHRASLTESVLVELESSVLPPFHPARIGPSRAARREYQFPNGSVIICGGLNSNTSDRIMSAQYDVIALFEGTEALEADWEKATSRLRNNRLPWQQGIVDCNPSHPGHWLNRRAEAGRMTRLLSRHSDNPSLTPGYMDKLRRLTGARRARLFLGLWTAAEGQIYEGWDEAMHLVDPGAVPRLVTTFGAVDWGFRNPGVMQIWGVCTENRLWRIREVYARQKSADWWADVACALVDEQEAAGLTCYPLICDSAEPRMIDLFNKRLGRDGRFEGPIAREAEKAVIAGISLVRDSLRPDRSALPNLYLVRGANRMYVDGRDPVDGDDGDGPADPHRVLYPGYDKGLMAAGLPYCTEQEFPSYVFREVKDGKPIGEEPDPACADHGLDALRYAVAFAYGREMGRETEKIVFDDWAVKNQMAEYRRAMGLDRR